ncbi:MAG: enoyl-CoA hydratase/isomerase family protein [Erythrobacter sp.]|nr:enoyl-CoA hydratase/isomerase family protein [Erythrobacter sp.]
MSHFNREMRGETVVMALANPPYNTLRSDILEEGAAVFAALAEAPPTGGVVLTGQGEDFTRGMDTKVAATFDEADAERARAGINAFCAGLHRLPCALVCAVNGHAIGAGGIMALCGDWVVTADGDQRIGLPEAKAGLVFPTVAQAILDHWLDPVWRRRLALSSQLLGPQEALAAGLVDEIVAPETVLDTAVRRAGELMAQPGFVACKRQLRAKANAEIDALMAQ